MAEIENESLFVSRGRISNEPRNVVIFLQRTLTGNRLDEIGRDFNIRKYSTVSTIIERTKQRAIKDRNLKKGIQQIKRDLIMSQEQT